jgi:hypothetical protein
MNGRKPTLHQQGDPEARAIQPGFHPELAKKKHGDPRISPYKASGL